MPSRLPPARSSDPIATAAGLGCGIVRVEPSEPWLPQTTARRSASKADGGLKSQ
ncbi:hypothetical protein [Mesorhizobium caraganae]|uniref:hypothetical protein n=1 Tax=Mesorhizobium caraganae TaxID=483206 RepID=UPI003ECDD481